LINRFVSFGVWRGLTSSVLTLSGARSLTPLWYAQSRGACKGGAAIFGLSVGKIVGRLDTLPGTAAQTSIRRARKPRHAPFVRHAQELNDRLTYLHLNPVGEILDLRRRLTGSISKSPFRQPWEASPVPAWLGSFRKRSQSTKAPCGQSGFGTSLGGHGASFSARHRHESLRERLPVHQRQLPTARPVHDLSIAPADARSDS
jgi:hypothetical protein